MSDNSKITRNDLIAIGYAIYSSLYEKDSQPLTPQEFGCNCEKYFKNFSGESEE